MGLWSVENFCGLECGFYLNRVHFCGLENFCGLEWASTRMRAKTVYLALQFSEKTRAVFVNCFECDSGVLCEPSRHSKDLSSARDRRAILVSFQVLKGPEPSRDPRPGGVSSPSAPLLLGPQVAQNATLAHHSFAAARGGTARGARGGTSARDAEHERGPAAAAAVRPDQGGTRRRRTERSRGAQ